MDKKFILLLSIVVLMTGLPVVGQEVCLDVDFTEGMPEDFTLECYDQMPVKGQDFKKIYPEMTWFTKGEVDSEDMSAAMSTSRRIIDMATDNWMITPKLQLPSENVWLKWTARSIHYHLRDGYKIMVSTKGFDYEDFTEILSVEEEEYLWTKRLVSLDAYAGQEVYIAFVHTSQNKFLLAIDDIFVGQPVESDFIVKDETPRFVGNVGTVSVHGVAMNAGLAGNIHVDCVVNGTDTIPVIKPDEVWNIGISKEFNVEVPVQVGKATHYKIIHDDNVLVEDSIICSYFPRTLLLEKATGAWCGNCPEVISYIQELKERYGEGIVCVEAHGFYNDIFEYMPYLNGLKANAFPTVLFNRNYDNPIYGASAKDRNTLKKIINKPTIAKINLSSDVLVGNSVNVSAKVTFATDVNNSSGKFRVGYVLIEKEIQTDLMRQVNLASSVPHHGEYAYIKSPIASDLWYYTNVVRSDIQAFVGVENSLPSKIEAGVEYSVDTEITLPNNVSDKSNLAVVAIVMNYYADDILNVAEVKIPVDSEGFVPNEIAGKQNEVSLTLNGNDELFVKCPAQTAFILEVLTMDGRQVSSFVGEGSAQVKLPQCGLYLLRISQDGQFWTKKVVL